MRSKTIFGVADLVTVFGLVPILLYPTQKKLTPEHRMIYLGIWLFYPCRPFYFPILVNDEVPSRMGLPNPTGLFSGHAIDRIRKHMKRLPLAFVAWETQRPLPHPKVLKCRNNTVHIPGTQADQSQLFPSMRARARANGS